MAASLNSVPPISKKNLGTTHGCFYELVLPFVGVLIRARLLGVYIRALIFGNSHMLVAESLCHTAGLGIKALLFHSVGGYGSGNF